MKERPRGVCNMVSLHDADHPQTSTASLVQNRERCARIGVSFHVRMRRGFGGLVARIDIYIYYYIYRGMHRNRTQ